MNTSRYDSNVTRPPYERKEPLRLTRRGRFALGATALFAAGLAVIGFGKLNNAIHPEYRFSDQTVTEVAGVGDTIWGIAGHIEGINNIDRHKAVDYLEAINPDLANGLSDGEPVKRPVSVEEDK